MEPLRAASKEGLVIYSAVHVLVSLIGILVFLHSTAGASTVRFAVFGDYGDGSSREASVAALVDSLGPDFIITTGDNSYGANPIDDNIGQYYSDYIGNYVGGYGSGSVPNRFFPSVGNHDWVDGGGIAAYTNYFTLPDSGVLDTNTSGNERYYDFVRGSVHFFALSSHVPEPDGRDSTSTQALWLKTQLMSTTSAWQIVFFHHPPYTSGDAHGSSVILRWPFEDWGVDAVLNGHAHQYERLLVDQNNDGDAIPFFVSGAGGRSLHGFGTPLTESVVRYNNDYGTMFVEATDTYMNFKFYSINSMDGTNGLVDVYQIPTDIPTGTDNPPAVATLFQNFPNPFNPTTTIGYSLESAAHVTLRIYDVSGRRVRTLADRTADSGRHGEAWDGRDDDGRQLAAGVYFYRLTTGRSSQTRKAILLK